MSTTAYVEYQNLKSKMWGNQYPVIARTPVVRIKNNWTYVEKQLFNVLIFEIKKTRFAILCPCQTTRQSTKNKMDRKTKSTKI